MADGGLRQLFKRHLPTADLVSVETWSTGRGVPDMNICFNGCEFWVEGKATESNAVEVRAEQVAWTERRIRAGGRVFLAVRLQTIAGPRKGPAKDELHLFHGRDMRAVRTGGLKGARAMIVTEGGPARWEWVAITQILIKQDYHLWPDIALN